MTDDNGQGMSEKRIAEARERLLAFKAERNYSWSEIAPLIGVKSGTLSPFGTGNYQGDNGGIALQIERFFVAQAVREQLDAEAPEPPAFIDTPTASRVVVHLRWAQRGKIIAFVGSPGIGKTTTLERYCETTPNAWPATMTPSTAGVQPMQTEVLKALGEKSATGTPQAMSTRILERVRGTNGLIIFDDAQNLSEKALEEIRSWNDKVGVGIALIGNEQVIQRLEGGSRKAAFAQLYSRLSMRHIQNGSSPEDADALSAAWGVRDEAQLGYLRQVASRPGGLRNLSHTVELASVLALGDGKPQPDLTDLKDAWAQLSTRQIAA